MKPKVQAFFDNATWTLTYVVFDETSRDAIVIDPVWDYDPASSKLSTTSAERVVQFVKHKELTVHLVLDTHAHADHVSGSQIVRKHFPNAKVGIGARIQDVQAVFKKVFNLEDEFPTDGRQFDLLLQDQSLTKAGTLEVKTIFTPGHTPACASYLIGDAVFTGDALFMPDSGVGRCDFPAGSADDLYVSVHDRLYALPDETRVFVGHDYQPDGREIRFETTIGEQKKCNLQINAETKKSAFVEFRKTRDATLAAPRLLLPSIQVNINAGHLPEPESNGSSYLKIPIRPS